MLFVKVNPTFVCVTSLMLNLRHAKELKYYSDMEKLFSIRAFRLFLHCVHLEDLPLFTPFLSPFRSVRKCTFPRVYVMWTPILGGKFYQARLAIGLRFTAIRRPYQFLSWKHSDLPYINFLKWVTCVSEVEPGTK